MVILPLHYVGIGLLQLAGSVGALGVVHAGAGGGGRRGAAAPLVILAVTSNVVLSLGLVGALSIVRFRTAIKDSRDTVYIFWSIIVGICCGVGDYAVACIGSAVTFAVILLLGCIKSDNRMLLIIRAHRSKQEPIKAQVYKLFRAKATLRVENTTEDTVELIYEITQKLLRRAEQITPDIPGSIYSLGSIDYVNLVMQNDEVSN